MQKQQNEMPIRGESYNDGGGFPTEATKNTVRCSMME
jgi:hypothetical protein